MSIIRKDDGLSEVIGFILIIAILVVIASLYVTYVVPAQGREAEIEHMTYIKDKFVDIKISLDSLWINQETNIDLIQNIEMGTLGQMTQGQFVFIPLANPVGSAGKMEVIDTTYDPATVPPEKDPGQVTVTLTKALIRPSETDDIDLNNPIQINPDLARKIQYSLGLGIHNIIDIDIPSSPAIPNANDFSQTFDLDFPLLTVIPEEPPEDPMWTASFTLSRKPSLLVRNEHEDDFKTNRYAEYMHLDYRYYLILLIEKRDRNNDLYPVIEEFIIGSYETRPPSIVRVNLQDPAYGLINYGLLRITDDTGSAIDQDIYVDPRYVEEDLDFGRNLGYLSYSAENYYWVPQKYIYQMGGVFLEQLDGTVSRTLPLISLGVIDGKPQVKVTLLRIIGFDRNFAGTAPVQIVTRITGIRKNIIEDGGVIKLLSPGPDNVEKVEIQFDHENPNLEVAWRNAFLTIKDAAVRSDPAFKNEWVEIDGSKIIIENHETVDVSDVSLDYTEVDVEILLQPIGWQGA